MKKVRTPRHSKRMVYFGQRTEKDAPFFTLSQALGVWGSAPSPIHRTPSADHARLHRQGNSARHAPVISAPAHERPGGFQAAASQ